MSISKKYGRTYHYDFSLGTTSDDRINHMKAEKFHIMQGTEWTDGMHPNDLYNLIKSSHKEAIKASERL